MKTTLKNIIINCTLFLLYSSPIWYFDGDTGIARTTLFFLLPIHVFWLMLYIGIQPQHKKVKLGAGYMFSVLAIILLGLAVFLDKI